VKGRKGAKFPCVVNKEKTGAKVAGLGSGGQYQVWATLGVEKMTGSNFAERCNSLSGDLYFWHHRMSRDRGLTFGVAEWAEVVGNGLKI